MATPIATLEDVDLWDGADSWFIAVEPEIESEENPIPEYTAEQIELIEALEEAMAERQRPKPPHELDGLTTDEIADRYNVGELKAFAKELGITGYSKLKQAELIETLQAEISPQTKDTK